MYENCMWVHVLAYEESDVYDMHVHTYTCILHACMYIHVY